MMTENMLARPRGVVNSQNSRKTARRPIDAWSVSVRTRSLLRSSERDQMSAATSPKANGACPSDRQGRAGSARRDLDDKGEQRLRSRPT